MRYQQRRRCHRDRWDRRRRGVRMQEITPLVDALLVLLQTPRNYVRQCFQPIGQRLHFIFETRETLFDCVLASRHVRHYFVDGVLGLEWYSRQLSEICYIIFISRYKNNSCTLYNTIYIHCCWKNLSDSNIDSTIFKIFFY